MILTLIFHACLFHAQFLPMRSVPGEWEKVSGPAPQALLDRMWYDGAAGYWEVEEGGPHAWQWTPLREGDRVTMDEAGVVRVEGLK